MKKCVVIFNGSLDSATTLEIARSRGFEIYAISFDYGQINSSELVFAKKYLKSRRVNEHKVVKIDLSFLGKISIVESNEVSVESELMFKNTPKEYVPARNTLFLSFALAYAESKSIKDIFVSISEKDYGRFPDCREQYFTQFEKLANLATACGVQEGGIRIHTPLLMMAKGDIIKEGIRLGVDFGLTMNCYFPGSDGNPCGKCPQCSLRAEGFRKNHLPDPLIMG